MEEKVEEPKKVRRRKKSHGLKYLSGRGVILGTYKQEDLPKILKKLNKVFGDLEYLSVEGETIFFRFRWKLSDFMDKKPKTDLGKKRLT